MKTIHREMIEMLTKGLSVCAAYTNGTLPYIASLQNPDGGFVGRIPQSDLYYTVFAVDVLLAGKACFNRDNLVCYLRSFNPDSLDLIHLCCLIRCSAAMGILDAGSKSKWIECLKKYRCSDGLYHHVQAGENASIYGTFMVFSAAQDLKEMLIDPSTLVSKLDKFSHLNGSYKNEYGQGIGMIPSTAAVMVMQSQLGLAVNIRTIDWVLDSITEQDGFAVSPRIPVADLLSTATALEALRLAKIDIQSIQGQCRDYVTSLLQNNGGFCANTFDSAVDAEYTFYGLLTMGNLHA